MMRRGAYYLLLSGTIGAAYVAAVVALNVLLQAGDLAGSPAFPVLFTLAVLLCLNPLRARIQAVVDRLFSRTRFDAGGVLDATGSALAATLDRERIGGLVREAVTGAIPSTGVRLFALGRDGGPLQEVGGDAEVSPALLELLAEGLPLTTSDPPGTTREARHAAREALTAIGAVVAVPLELGPDLVGALAAGPKRSGLPWRRRDLELLRAVAAQAAIALENARSFEALVTLNARLEERVRERATQLEATHRELGDAIRELRSAETQLVHSEKMASLGRLVAGVAHEINNPVSFIATSVEPLRRRLARATSDAPPDVAPLLREAAEIVDVMARGAERTAAIVHDLRTFSRLGEARRKSVDVHDGLEVTLRLLESRWRDRVTVHREYGSLPTVECDPAQVNQVFMNVLANACDAAPVGGNVWVRTQAVGDDVVVAIRDDGPGMPPEVRARVFDPFFTTKDVGGGTGLGLAISHGVMAAHGGRIEVESAPGAGATFRIVLPVVTPAASLDTVATGNR